MRLPFRPTVMDLCFIVVICCSPGNTVMLQSCPAIPDFAGLLQASPCPAMGFQCFGPELVKGLNRSSALGTGQGPKITIPSQAKAKELNREEAGSNIVNSSWVEEGLYGRCKSVRATGGILDFIRKYLILRRPKSPNSLVGW